MKYANLSRYDDHQLEVMLRAYSEMSIVEWQAGHYALARWAQGMQTHITIEMNRRRMLEEEVLSDQEPLFPNSLDR